MDKGIILLTEQNYVKKKNALRRLDTGRILSLMQVSSQRGDQKLGLNLHFDA